ncbi:glycosyltransferase family 2 protein [Bacteroidota bacterium]
MISIIVPIYNTENYLRKCIDSLLVQTYKHIEIILVNDGSLDNSQNIINEYYKNYPHQIISVTKNNGGLGSARNFGLQFARGDYIGFLDSDDYVEPIMYEKLINKVKEESAQLVICDFYFVNEQGKILDKTQIGGHHDLNIHSKIYAHKYGRTEVYNKLYHRDLFFTTGIRYPDGWFEDYPTTPLLIEAANIIAYVEEPLLFYLQRKGSIMNKTFYGFSNKNYDILSMTAKIISDKNKYQNESYTFILDEILPLHAFLKFYSQIISINKRHERLDNLKMWCKTLNSILPGWQKSSAIRNKKKQFKNHIKRFYFSFIVRACSKNNFWLLNLFILIYNPFHRKYH